MISPSQYVGNSEIVYTGGLGERKTMGNYRRARRAGYLCCTTGIHIHSRKEIKSNKVKTKEI